MRKTRLAATLAALVLGAGTSTFGQTLSDLLQKGIYTQETVGDLNAAIKIYRQIVSSAKDSRAYAAQAQYRLGVCLVQKGDQAEALKTFKALIKDYPDQTDLVAKAQSHIPADMKLLPSPWSVGEQLVLSLRFAAGLHLGTMVYSVEAGPLGSNTELVQERAYVIDGTQSSSQVEVDRDTMRPVRSSFRHTLMGEYATRYESNRAMVSKDKAAAQPVSLDGPSFDNQEWMYLLRRLPLTASFKSNVGNLSPVGVPMKLAVEVTGEEDVEVPTGKYHCYRFEFKSIKQTFWVTMSQPRHVVKFQANGITGELKTIGQIPSVPSTYSNSKLGFSVTAPAGWLIDELDSDEGEQTINLLDPAVTSTVAMAVVTKERADPAEDALRRDTEKSVQSKSKMLQNYKVRADGYSIRQVAGKPAISYLADYTIQGGVKMVEYRTVIRTDSQEARLSANCPPDQLDAYRARFDAILESLKLK